MPDVHLQHLALHFDRANEHPDLFLAERLWVRGGQFFERHDVVGPEDQRTSRSGVVECAVGLLVAEGKAGQPP